MKVRSAGKVVAIAVAFLFSAPAFAGDKGKGRGACRADVQRLCKDVQRGEGRIKKCLKDHEADLSDECKTAIKNHRKPR